MGIKTRGKNLPASVVARYSGRQPNLKCNICNRTFSYDKNLQKHMTLHSNTSVESCDTRMLDSSVNDISSLKGEMESTEHVVDIQLPKVSRDAGDRVLPVAVKKINSVMKEANVSETSTKDQSSGNHLQNCIGEKENEFSEAQPLRDSGNDTNARMVLEGSGSRSVHTVDITASLVPPTVLAKENLKARTSISPLSHPEVQIALSNPSPLLCDFCGRSFSNPGNFQQHRIMHTGEMPLKCYYCKSSFSEHAAWKEHLATHSQNNKTPKQHQEFIQYKEIHALSDSNMTSQLSSLTTSHCTADAETMIVKLNLDLNDKPITNVNTITATEMAHVRSGRLEQLIEALTKEVAQNSVDVQGEKNPKGQYSTIPVNNLVIVHTNSVPAGSDSSDKEFTETTVLSSKQYQCHFCPRSFPRACHLTNHEKIHTRGKRNPSHASTHINRPPQATLESSCNMKSPLVPGEELAKQSSVKTVDNVIQVVAQSNEQILSAVPDQSHPRVAMHQVGQQWSCDVCSKQCINESHLLQHQKIHMKRKRNNDQLHTLIVHQPQLSAKVLSSQEETANNPATTAAFLQSSGANRTLTPDENACCICRKRLDPLSEEKIVHGSSPNTLCTACMHTNQISDKKCYPQPLRSSKNTTEYSLGKEIYKTHQNRQSRKYNKSWFYVSKVKLTKSIQTSQKFPFFSKLSKKKLHNKWSLCRHSQHHPASKRTTFHHHRQNKYFFQWKLWLTARDNHIYRCPHCDKTFKSLGGFCVHQRSHRTDFFVCGQCNLRFFLKNSLKYHSLKCCKDSVLGSSASDSVELAELHTRDGTRSSNEESKFTPNQKPGHPEAATSTVKWECKTCGDHFDQALQLVQHYQADHTESKPFQCPFCKQLCNNTEQALNHLSSHRTTNNNRVIRVDEGSNPQISAGDSSCNLHPKLICSICEKSIPSLEDLKTHLNSHSAVILPVQVKPTTDDVTATEKHQCALDNKTSPQNKLEQHLQAQSGEKVHLCEFCGKSFSHGNKLQAHCHLHIGDSPYNCPHCNKSFSRNDVYERHVQTHTHAYQCRVCSRRYQLSSDLEQHHKESNHHLNVSCKVSAAKRLHPHYTYKCNVCQKVVRNLKIHMRIHDPDPDTVYKCNVCPKTFLQSGNLKQHLMMHSGERPLRCEFCDKGFIHSSHLKRHRQTHTGERPHQCGYCQRSFAERAKLRMHLRTHTKEKPYTCDYKGCGKSFSVKSVLDAHQLLHTGERPHSCEECGRTFTQRCNLIAHRRTHTGERPFKCTICQRAFRNSSNLKDHERLHSDDRPFKCNICSKVFKRSDYLAKHLLTHSKEQNTKSRSKGRSVSKRKVVNHGGQEQSEIANSSTIAPGEVPKDNYLPSSHVTMKLTCNSSPSKVNKNVRMSSPLAITSIENVGFQQLIKTFSQEAVVPPGELASGSVVDGYSGCGTVENVIEIYTEQDSVGGQMCEDNSTMLGPQIVSSGQADDLDSLERYFQCHLCHKTFDSALMLGSHVLLHIQEKGESQVDMAQQTEIEEALRRHSSESVVTVESPKEAESDMKKAVCETLNAGTAERPTCQSASDEAAEISPKTLQHLSELLYYLTDYVKGDLEFQLIGNGPSLHLNSIRQTLRSPDGDKLELDSEIKATLIEFQTQPEQSSSLVTGDSFACLLCLFSSSTVGAFAEHICKHFSGSGLTSASLETETATDSLLADSKKLSELKDMDQDDSPSENASASTTDNIHLPIKQALIPVSQIGLRTDDQKQNVTLSTLDDADIDHLSARTCDPHNVIITFSHQVIQNTENSSSGCGKTQSPSSNNQYKEDVVEKSNLKAIEGTTKPGNPMTGFFQDSGNVVFMPKDDLRQGKVSKASQAEELFNLEQKGFCKIDSSHQPNENGDIRKTQSSPSTLNLDSNSFTFCLECKPGEKPFKCGICKKMFKKLKYVKDHIKLHVGKTSLVCEICGKVFRRASNLKQHHKIHQSKVDGEQPAVIALTATEPTKEKSANPKNNSNEYNHEPMDKGKKNPLEGQAQLFTCNICFKTFQLQTYLKQHLKTHTSLKPYVCEHCGMGFSQRAYLTKHSRVHTGEKPYKCGYCDKGFARSELLTRHTRTHTKEKPYSCPHCSNTFALYNTLKRHVRTHTGQKPFKCLVCDQAFTQRGNLSIHMRLHTGDRPFKCDNCQARFVHSSNLKKHLRSCN